MIYYFEKILKIISDKNKWRHCVYTKSNIQGEKIYINNYKIPNKSLKKIFKDWNKESSVSCYMKCNFVCERTIFSKSMSIDDIREVINEQRC